jgi:CheY-like chemotaxis protein
LVVDTATNGREALALTAQHPYAVIVLDLMMPDINGLDVIEQLRSRDACMLPRVVVITAAVQLVRRASLAQVGQVLLKPVRSPRVSGSGRALSIRGRPSHTVAADIFVAWRAASAVPSFFTEQ